MKVELQKILADPKSKENLIRKLLETEEKDRAVKKSNAPAKKVPEEKNTEYEGKYDPENPENEMDFKKAYNKVNS